jgi:molecular chaperone GrpE
VTDIKDNPFEEPVEVEVGAAAVNDGSDAAADPGSAEIENENEFAMRLHEEQVRHREAIMRMQAETENLRKRMARDLDRSRKFALEAIMKDLLQVSDSLQRGLEVDDDSLTVESLREGQQLTLRMLGKVMSDHHLEEIDPAGEAFDPEWHEAMTMLPSAEEEENTVLEVLQKGYRLHDRLIRPARVVVSRKP